MKNVLIAILLFLVLTSAMVMSERSKEQIVLEIQYCEIGKVQEKITPYYSKGYRVVGTTSYVSYYTGSTQFSNVIVIMEK